MMVKGRFYSGCTPHSLYSSGCTPHGLFYSGCTPHGLFYSGCTPQKSVLFWLRAQKVCFTLVARPKSLFCSGCAPHGLFYSGCAPPKSFYSGCTPQKYVWLWLDAPKEWASDTSDIGWWWKPSARRETWGTGVGWRPGMVSGSQPSRGDKDSLTASAHVLYAARKTGVWALEDFR